MARTESWQELNLGKNWIILYKTKFMTKSWNSLKSDFFKYSRFSVIRLTFSPSATPANIFFDFVDLKISIIPNLQHFSETIYQIREQFLPKLSWKGPKEVICQKIEYLNGLGHLIGSYTCVSATFVQIWKTTFVKVERYICKNVIVMLLEKTGSSWS